MQRRFAYIASVCRTPIGIYNGSLSSLTAVQLGNIAASSCFDRCNIPKEIVDEVIIGNVCSANLGQNPARQVSYLTGLPDSASCTTVNKVCSSGIKSVAYAAQSIELGLSNVVLAGGIESMSNIPYYNPKQRFGQRMGNTELIDGMLKDGLTCAKDNIAMGLSADAMANEYGIKRKDQDDFAVQSYQRAQLAYSRNAFDQELVHIEIPSKKGPPIIISQDEGCWKLNEQKMRHLNPAFNVDGSITAGNSSQLSDGGAAVIVCSEETIKELNVKPLARILSYADAEQTQDKWSTTPSIAIPKALKRAGLNIDDMAEQDFFEINEAFAAVGLVNKKILKINEFNLNMYGGAIALGHPIGCSGARVLVTLLSVLKENQGRYGIVGVCNGGGGASAMVIEHLI